MTNILPKKTKKRIAGPLTLLALLSGHFQAFAFSEILPETEEEEYVSSPPILNARFKAVNFFLGEFGVFLDYKLKPNVTVGPRLSYFSYSFLEKKQIEGGEVGVRANVFPWSDAFESGWYFGPSLSYTTQKVEDPILALRNYTQHDGLNAYIYFGRQWVWDSGFNIQGGLGPSYSFGLNQLKGTDIEAEKAKKSENELEAIVQSIGLGIEFTIGLIF